MALSTRCRLGFRRWIRVMSTDALLTSNKSQELPHIPVMTKEIIRFLNPAAGKTYIDMTFGAGGHSTALLDSCQDVNIIGLDRDRSALRHGRKLITKFGSDRVKLIHGAFTDLPSRLADLGLPPSNIADGMLFDVGASSMQFSDRRRGFGLKNKGPLDMRMNSEEVTPTAAEVLNKLEEKDLYKILKKYGQEKKARQIARQIIEHRQMLGPILTTRDLQDLVSEVYSTAEELEPQDKLGRKQHPATLTFQALRIFVNDELNQLYNGLKVAHRLLKPNGVCAVLTFHSLEHAIPHQVFKAKDIIEKEALITPDVLNQVDQWESNCRSYKPSSDEVNSNPRSRSAELRIAYKKSHYH